MGNERNEQMLEDELNSVNLLFREEDGGYRFTHDTFQDCFCAKYIAKLGIDGIENLDALIIDPNKRQTVTFLSGMIENSDELVRRIIKCHRDMMVRCYDEKERAIRKDKYTIITYNSPLSELFTAVKVVKAAKSISEEVVDDLTMELISSYEKIRGITLDMIAQIAQIGGKMAVSYLIPFLINRHRDGRTAADGLSKSGNELAVDPLIYAYMRSIKGEDDVVLAPPDADTWEWDEWDEWDEKEERVAGQKVYASYLAVTGNQRAIDTLVALAKDDDHAVQHYIANLLMENGFIPKMDIEDYLKNRLTEDSNRKSIKMLIRLLHDPTPFFKRMAIGSFATIKSEDDVYKAARGALRYIYHRYGSEYERSKLQPRIVRDESFTASLELRASVVSLLENLTRLSEGQKVTGIPMLTRRVYDAYAEQGYLLNDLAYLYFSLTKDLFPDELKPYSYWIQSALNIEGLHQHILTGWYEDLLESRDILFQGVLDILIESYHTENSKLYQKYHGLISNIKGLKGAAIRTWCYLPRDIAEKLVNFAVEEIPYMPIMQVIDHFGIRKHSDWLRSILENKDMGNWLGNYRRYAAKILMKLGEPLPETVEVEDGRDRFHEGHYISVGIDRFLGGSEGYTPEPPTPWELGIKEEVEKIKSQENSGTLLLKKVSEIARSHVGRGDVRLGYTCDAIADVGYLEALPYLVKLQSLQFTDRFACKMALNAIGKLTKLAFERYLRV